MALPIVCVEGNVLGWQDYLVKRLSGIFKKSPSAEAWITLLDTDEESRILGSSLATDLASDSVTVGLVATVLSGLPFPADDPCRDFVTAVRAHGKARLRSAHKLSSTDSPPRSQYVRALGLREFYKYSYKDQYGLSMSEEDVNAFRQSLIDRSDGLPIGEVRNFTGAHGTNWIADLAELEHRIGALQSLDADSPTTFLDLLGLPDKKPIILGLPPELLLVTYPPNFSGEVWKPTTFDGYWIGGSYVSWYKKSWGKTHPCSGASEGGVGERVHRRLPRLEEGFRAWYVGKLSEVKKDRKSLYREARNRWQACNASLA